MFPGVRDEVHGLATDGDGVWVGSEGNGLAYLSGDKQLTYWNRDRRLPMNTLHGVVVDADGAVWIATASAGLARFRPTSGEWTYYTTESGLPSNDVNALYVDKLGDGRTLFVATANGLASFATQP